MKDKKNHLSSGQMLLIERQYIYIRPALPDFTVNRR